MSRFFRGHYFRSLIVLLFLSRISFFSYFISSDFLFYPVGQKVFARKAQR
ncbi:hypothetical protein FACS189418_8270 [Clostridia bacterium]|nr:hypothetical protein FACS189418_8270 [Clostridia bacterium]